MVYYKINRLEDVADHLEWLHPSERQVYETFRFEKRKNDWLTGRWTAKNLLKDTWFNNLNLEYIEIKAGENRAPFVYINNVLSKKNITISHSQGMAFCASSPEHISIGCDMEKIESRSPHFITDYYTDFEINKINSHPHTKYSKETLFTIFWSAKESVMKVLRTGMKLHPHRLEVTSIAPNNHKGFRLMVKHADTGIKYYGWGQVSGEMVFVMMSDRRIGELQEI